MPHLADQLATVRAAIADAAARAGRAPEEVRLVAVSKTQPPEAVQEVLEAGQTVFGESRVQEARAKIPILPSRARWHFIGHLQKNKIRQALALGFELFHGVDSLDLAKDIERIAGEIGAQPRILLEVNVAEESTKFGFNPAKLRAEMDELLGLSGLQIDGLMAMAPFAEDAESSRPYFAALRKLRDKLREEFQAPLPELSMGMSGDYPVAIEEGATLVRVGGALFGTRSSKGWRPEENSATLS